MDWVWHELRYAIRSLSKSPLYTLLGVLALALGIGANSAVFSVFYSVLLKPLPYAQPERLVVALHDGEYPVSPADFLDWAKETRSFERLGAAQAWGATLTGQSEPELLHAMQVTGDVFPLLGVRPMIGRSIEPGDDTPGRNQILVLSYALWQRRFAGDRGVIGRRVTVNAEPYVIAGVMPPSFRFAPFWVKDAEVWAPLSLAARLNDRGGRSLRVFGRLRDGVTLQAAQAELDVINRRLAAAYPATNTDLPLAAAVPLQEKAVGKVRATLVVLFGTVAFVMLIACANVANLLLVRASGRERETAVHLALGANPRRLMFRSILEALALAALGGAAGLVLAHTTLGFLLRTLPEASLPRQGEVTLDGSAVFFTLGLTLLTGLLCGLAPARGLTRRQLSPALHGSSRSASAGRSQKRTQQVLVVAEVALAVMLLTGAGLMIRSFGRLHCIDPGFDSHRLLTFTVAPAGRAPRVDFFARLQRQLEAVPGVESASLINHLPVNGDMWTLSLHIAGRPAPPPGREPGAVYRVVEPRYFATMGIPLRQGRDFTESDKSESPAVVIVNEALARRHWPGESPLGSQIAIGSGPETHWLTIVGVSGDAKQREWTANPIEEVYLPHPQASLGIQGAMTVVARVRSEGPGPALVDQVRQLDADVPTSRPIEMEQVIADQLWQSRLSMTLLTAFSAVAMLLAAVGIYGIISYTVSRQLREFGIRMALGATTRGILGGVLGQGMTMICAGLLLGLAGSLALARTIAGLLYGVSSVDLPTFAAVPVVLLSTGLAACYFPARRATTVDPALSLRAE